MGSSMGNWFSLSDLCASSSLKVSVLIKLTFLCMKVLDASQVMMLVFLDVYLVYRY